MSPLSGERVPKENEKQAEGETSTLRKPRLGARSLLLALLREAALLCGGAVTRLRDLAGVFASELDGPPHVPARDSAIGTPTLPEFKEFLRLGDAALPIRDGKAFLHALVVDGQYIGAAEAENQKHLDGPCADAAH